MPTNKKIEPRLPPILHTYLDDMVNTGFYGDKVSTVARNLIEMGIRGAITKGHIKNRDDNDSQK